jgi:nicotinamidase-related amidase
MVDRYELSLTSKHTMKEQRYEELKWTEAPLCCNDLPPSLQEEVEIKRRLPLHGETTALLVVDVQPEYWSNCPSVRGDFPNFPSNLRSTVEICRERRAKIIWVRADYRMAHSPWLVQFERLRGRTPGFMVEVPCNPESEDFTWEDFAAPEGGEVIIPKTSWSSTSDTALKEVLRVSKIDTVLVCGLITSVCVQHSAFGVFEAGYRTLLVTDACADRGRARHDAALALYGDYMYELVTSRDLRHPRTGLLSARPVWLTLDSIVRRSNGSDVSPLSSFGDLQNAVEALEKNDGGQEGSSAVHGNEASTAPPSSMTSSSECSD